MGCLTCISDEKLKEIVKIVLDVGIDRKKVADSTTKALEISTLNY